MIPEHLRGAAVATIMDHRRHITPDSESWPDPATITRHARAHQAPIEEVAALFGWIVHPGRPVVWLNTRQLNPAVCPFPIPEAVRRAYAIYQAIAAATGLGYTPELPRVH